MAFWEDVDLPWDVFGPVDFWEFWRLAASLRGEILFLEARGRRWRVLILDLELRGADADWSIKAMLMVVSPGYGPFWFPVACTLRAGNGSQESLKYFRVGIAAYSFWRIVQKGEVFGGKWGWSFDVGGGLGVGGWVGGFFKCADAGGVPPRAPESRFNLRHLR